VCASKLHGPTLLRRLTRADRTSLLFGTGLGPAIKSRAVLSDGHDRLQFDMWLLAGVETLIFSSISFGAQPPVVHPGTF
jgi:hypothetical protein